MPSFSKQDQTRRVQKVKRLAFGSSMPRAQKPMRKRSLTNARAVAWREEYLPKRAAFLRERDVCEMNITSPAICPPYPHPSTEIQHMVQTSLDPSIENLLDETHWIPSCHDANWWCGTHPIEAEALGLEMRPRARDIEERDR